MTSYAISEELKTIAAGLRFLEDERHQSYIDLVALIDKIKKEDEEETQAIINGLNYVHRD